jgi:hypothetical protein
MDRRQALTALGVSVPAAAILVHAADAAEHTDKKGSPWTTSAYSARSPGEERPRIVIERATTAPVTTSCTSASSTTRTAPASCSASSTSFRTRSTANCRRRAEYYHPHTYEVTSGLLVAPGMDADGEASSWPAC